MLRNPTIETAELETTPAGILLDGRGFEHCDVAVETNVVPDSLDREAV